MPSVEQLSTAELAERYGDAWNTQDLEAIMAMQGEDMVFHLHVEGFEPAVGPEQVRFQFAYFFEAWASMHFAMQEQHVTDALIVNRFRFHAELVQPFPLLGEVIEPTGRGVAVHGADVITVRDGLVRAKHTYMDALAMRRQIGA